MSDNSLLIRPLSDLFPATARWIYIDAATSGLLPETAKERVSAVFEAQLVASFGENHALSMAQSCREFFARLIHAAAADIGLFASSVEALDSIAVRLEPRQQSGNLVLCTALSRPSFAAYWRNFAQRHGLEIREAAFDAGGFLLAPLEKLIDSATLLVAMPALSHVRGWRLPVSEIGNLCRERNVVFLVDGSASVGIIRTDVVRDGIDGLFVAAEGNALGVHGLAVACLDEACGSSADPFLRRVKASEYRKEMPHLLSLAAAQEVLRILDECGATKIERHAFELAEQLRLALEELGMPVERPQISGQLAHVAAIGVPVESADTSLRDPGLRRFTEQLTSGRVRYAVRGGQLQFGFHLYNRLRDVMDVRRIAVQSLAD
jgi:cysteine desulfurase/selenocysteine lyase